jgi:hypothetical protein
MIKIYVGFSITGAPDEFIESVQRLRQKLREEHEVLEFVPVLEGTPQDVYRNDIKESVANCDLMVAVCDLPSTGLGFEMACAVLGDKPVLAVAHHNARMSRLIMGVDHEKYAFRRYEHLGEVVQFVREKVGQHFGARP